MSCPGRNAPSIAHVTVDRDGHALRWLANHDKNFRSSCLAWLGGFGRRIRASGTAGLELVGAPGDRTRSRRPVWRCLAFGTRSRVWRRLEFGTRNRVWRCLEFETRSRSGRSQKKRASLPKQRRL